MMMMMMMKKSVFLVICTLLFSSLAVFASQSIFGPEECCFNHVQKRLPKNNVQDYRWTDRKCAKESVILVMRKGELCADPTEEWVMRIIRDQDRKKERLRATATATAGPPRVSPQYSE
ncbi:C-C motif chemokine 3-like 1 [Sphaeramia orbicularis]|uniref:C-C motif chemokine n=1 Tax=Sphaeramia orbicularis TaxID=375764 RepID=A0A673BW71_9TELE|nr:C-C motif chemokine 3-like 1 [Sphaeramia orbicularis]